jgi:hypothetical protein
VPGRAGTAVSTVLLQLAAAEIAVSDAMPMVIFTQVLSFRFITETPPVILIARKLKIPPLPEEKSSEKK